MITSSPSITRGLLLLSAIVLFTQCEKDEPSTEASIEVTMGLHTNSAMQGKLTIEQAVLHPFQVDMIAKRTDGNQLTFSLTNPAGEKIVTIDGSDVKLFDMPAQQGKYDPIEITLTLEEDPYELIVFAGTDENPPTVDFADFISHGKPSLAFVAKFNNRGQSTRVFVALNVTDRIRMDGSQLGGTAIALSRENRARIIVDPAYLLQDITTQALEDAVTIEHLGETVILIHRDFNPDLYDLIIDHIYDLQSVRTEVIEIGNG